MKAKRISSRRFLVEIFLCILAIVLSFFIQSRAFFEVIVKPAIVQVLERKGFIVAWESIQYASLSGELRTLLGEYASNEEAALSQAGSLSELQSSQVIHFIG